MRKSLRHAISIAPPLLKHCEQPVTTRCTTSPFFGIICPALATKTTAGDRLQLHRPQETQETHGFLPAHLWVSDGGARNRSERGVPAYLYTSPKKNQVKEAHRAPRKELSPLNNTQTPPPRYYTYKKNQGRRRREEPLGLSLASFLFFALPEDYR